MALVRAAASEQDAAIYLTAALTGLRRGELVAVRWRDVDSSAPLPVARRAIVSSRRSGLLGLDPMREPSGVASGYRVCAKGDQRDPRALAGSRSRSAGSPRKALSNPHSGAPGGRGQPEAAPRGWLDGGRARRVASLG
jgi:hypothetical protein